MDATSPFPGGIVQHTRQRALRGVSSSGAVSLCLLIASAFGSGAVGREVSSSMKSFVWVTGGILHRRLGPVWLP